MSQQENPSDSTPNDGSEDALASAQDFSTQFLEQRLREKFPGAAGQWIEGLVLEISGSVLSIRFAHAHFARWFRDKKKAVFEKALLEILAPAIPRIFYSWPNDVPKNLANVPQIKSQPHERAHDKARDPFENFLINEKNLLPLQAARRVARDEASPCLVLFCGQSGVGKSYMLRSILDSLSDHVGLSSLYQANDFFAQGLMAHGPEKLWAGRKAILLDDIHAARGNESREEQLAALADAAGECAGRRLILSMLGEAGDVAKFGARLASRLESGVVAEIAPPDLDVRLRYLRQLAKDKQISLGKEQSLFMARRAPGFRQLQGLLDRANLWRIANEKNLDPGALDMLAKNSGQPPVSFDSVLEQAARAFNVAAADILGPSRKPDLVMARQAAMYLCRKKLGLSFPELGKAFRRDHSTVIHGIRKIGELAKRDKVLHNLLSEIENSGS